MKLLYLHGFRSSPNSMKAQKCLAHVEKLRKMGDRIDWYCPQLPPSPQQAIEMVMQHIESWQGHQMAVIGSSMGGFYATYIAEYKRCGAVLLNPCVAPAIKMQQYIEDHPVLDESDKKYVQPSFVEEFAALDVPVTMPERYFLILSKDDEELDYREAVKHYAKSEKKLLEKSGHRIDDFDDHIEDIFDFIGLGV